MYKKAANEILIGIRCIKGREVQLNYSPECPVFVNDNVCSEFTENY